MARPYVHQQCHRQRNAILREHVPNIHSAAGSPREQLVLRPHGSCARGRILYLLVHKEERNLLH
eukprot:5273732-Pyramimonas_sp.AAC.1